MKMLRDKEELLMCDEMTNSHPSHHSLSLEVSYLSPGSISLLSKIDK